MAWSGLLLSMLPALQFPIGSPLVKRRASIFKTLVVLASGWMQAISALFWSDLWDEMG